MTDLSQMSDMELLKATNADIPTTVKVASKIYDIPEDLLGKMVKQESGGKQEAVSPKGARGVMQIMPGTAKDLGINVNDHVENILGGAKYLKQQKDKFGSWERALWAYNAGPGKVEARVMPKETRDYLKNIAGVTPQQAKLTAMSDEDLLRLGKQLGIKGKPAEGKQVSLYDKTRQALFPDRAEISKKVDAALNKPQKELQEPKTFSEFVTKNIPESANRAASGLIKMPGELAESAKSAYTQSRQAGSGVIGAGIDAVAAPIEDVATGLYEQGKQIAKEPVKTFLKDPVGTSMFIGMGRQALKGGPEIGKPVDFARETPGNLRPGKLEPLPTENPSYKAKVNNLIAKTFQPKYGRGTRTAQQQRAYLDQTRQGLETISKEKPNLNVVNDVGEKVDKIKTLNEAQQAHEQTMKSHFQKWDAMSQAAGEKGVKVGNDSIISEIKEALNDRTLQFEHKEDVAYLQKLLAEQEEVKANGGYTPSEMQREITRANAKETAWRGNANPETATQHVIEMKINALRRKELDAGIESTEGEGYQQLKTEYRNLKTFQDDLNRAALKQSKQAPKGFFDISDLISGPLSLHALITGNVPQMATAIAIKGGAKYVKWRNNPNTLVSKLFKHVDEAVSKSPETIDVIPEEQKLPTGGTETPPGSAGSVPPKPEPPSGDGLAEKAAESKPDPAGYAGSLEKAALGEESKKSKVYVDNAGNARIVPKSKALTPEQKEARKANIAEGKKKSAPTKPAPKEGKGMEKEAWEMTRKEFTANQGKDTPYVQQQRDAIVKQAYKQGKPVPAEVLKDYPDLKPEASKAETPANQTGWTTGDKALSDFDKQGKAAKAKKATPESIIESHKAEHGEKPVVLRNESDPDRMRGAIIAPSSKKPDMWQVTYFDKDGFSMDVTTDSQVKAVKEALQDGYSKAEPGLLDEDMKGDSFQKGNDKTTAKQKAESEEWEKRQAEKANQDEGRYNGIVKMSADSPAQLRPADVYRVIWEAKDQGHEEPFKKWLLKQDLPERTRTKVVDWVGDEEEKAEAEAIIRKQNEEEKAKLNNKPKATNKLPSYRVPSLKDQKVNLLKQVDEKIKTAKVDPEFERIRTDLKYLKATEIRRSNHKTEIKNLEAERETRLNALGKVTFDIGSTRYRINTDKGSLENFRAQVRSGFPTSEAVPTKRASTQASGPLSTRIEGEGVSYYNDFKPHHLSLDSLIRMSNLKKNAAGEPAVLTTDGFVSNGHVSIIPNKKVNLKIRKDWNCDEAIPDSGLVPATEIMEFKLERDVETPKVHFRSESGKSAVANAQYVDAVLTEHPNAKPFIKDGDHAIVFKEGDKVVGFVMPFEDDYFTDFIKEQRKIRKGEE